MTDNVRFCASPGLGDWEVWDAERGQVRWSDCTRTEASLIAFALNAAVDRKRLYALTPRKLVWDNPSLEMEGDREYEGPSESL